MQCHIEMTADMIATWCKVGADEVAASLSSPAVQQVVEIQPQMHDNLPQLNSIAARLYGRWIEGISA
jgi:hypothetical protein